MKTKILLALVTGALAALPVLSSGCSGFDEKAYTSAKCPPFGENGDDTLRGHGGFIYGLAFSPDGRRLASGSGYAGHGEVKVWDAVLWER